ncbi:MAG TPA: rod-binding protein [Polyangiaceae bacterium]|nr:rod-binding protein [Polyangiaceae bacterium]
MRIPEKGAGLSIGLAQAKNLDPASANANAHPSAETVKAAREFEQIFLRKMLSSLEKTGRANKDGGSLTSGGDVYSSMVVGALADAVSAAGGIGLADLIVRATLVPEKPPPAPAADEVRARPSGANDGQGARAAPEVKAGGAAPLSKDAE